MKEEKGFNRIWRALISMVASFLVIYIAMRLLKRKVNKDRAIKIASKYLESNHGITTIFSGVQEDKNVYTINFSTHSVYVEKMSGNILGVVKL